MKKELTVLWFYSTKNHLAKSYIMTEWDFSVMRKKMAELNIITMYLEKKITRWKEQQSNLLQRQNRNRKIIGTFEWNVCRADRLVHEHSL